MYSILYLEIITFIHVSGCIGSQWLHIASVVAACGIQVFQLVPWPGIEPRPPAWGAQSLSHWATREAPSSFHFEAKSALLLCFCPGRLYWGLINYNKTHACWVCRLVTFDRCIHTHVNTTTITIWIVSALPERFLMSLCSKRPPPTPPQGRMDVISIAIR